jgi:hypothetical protein
MQLLAPFLERRLGLLKSLGGIMKLQTGHFMAMLTVLSFLSLPPTQVGILKRDIASVVEDKTSFPLYEAQALKTKPESILVEKDLTEEKFQAKVEELKEVVEKSRKEFKKDERDEKIVSGQRQEIEGLVTKVLTLQQSEKEFGIKESGLSPHKEILESLLKDLEANESLLAKKEEPKVEVASSIEPKPEVKEEPKKEICEAEEKQKALTLQVEELMKQQQEIVKIMTMMSQSLINLQQQQMLFYSQGAAWRTSPYQYQEPMTAGNWVYYPRGFQPEQNNIFSPGASSQTVNPMQSFYPDQIHQGQGPQPTPGPQNFTPSSWMLGTGDFGQGFYPQPLPAPMAPQYGMQNLNFNFSPAGSYF